MAPLWCATTPVDRSLPREVNITYSDALEFVNIAAPRASWADGLPLVLLALWRLGMFL